MQKKLLTMAVGAALAGAAFAASADVTVYGRAQIEYAQVTNDSPNYAFPTAPLPGGSWNNGNTVLPNQTRGGLLDNKMGRFGIKADEDLGSGWKGVANFEWQVDTADGLDGTPISERVTYVGIAQKSIGTLYFGQDHSPYKLSGVPLDPFIATTLEARNNFGMSGNRDGFGVLNGHSGFVQDGVFFKSASWAGAYVNAYFGLEHASNTVNTCTAFGNCDAPSANGAKTAGDMSIVAGWKGDIGPVGLSVFGGYNLLANTTNASDPTMYKIGGQVTIAKAHTISLQYENADKGVAGTGIDEAQYYFIGYQGKFGPVTAVAQYGWMDSGSLGTISYSGDYLAIGAIYNMSKTFRLFGGWRATTIDRNDNGAVGRDDSVLSLGMRKDF